MKIVIKNFGPIREFTLDVERDFSLIVGHNNIGKSYAITVAYLILKTLLNAQRYSRYMMFEYMESNASGRKRVFSSDMGSLVSQNDITNVFESEMAAVLNNLLITPLNESFDNTFDSLESLQNQYTSAPLQCQVQSESATIFFELIDKRLCVTKVTLSKRRLLRKVRTSRQIVINDNEIILYHNEKDDSHLMKCASLHLMHTTMGFLRESVTHISDIHYLPASRSGLYLALSAFGKIFAELSKSRSFIRNKVELPGIPEPLSDYFLTLSEIKASKKNSDTQKINLIAKKIEKEILKGNVEFDTKTRKLIYIPQGTTLRLDLSSTSSMVSEISPIVSYLRYVLSEPSKFGDPLTKRDLKRLGINENPARPLVIIEEPEAHLHPDVQIKLTKIFGELARDHIKLIITSHSNYIFGQASNLLLSKSLHPKNVNAIVFKTSPQGSMGVTLSTDDLGIDDQNFLDPSERIYEEKTALIEELNQE